MRKNLFLALLTLFICVSQANAQDDEDKYKRCVLLEEFTGEGCSNCPAAATIIAEVMFSQDYKYCVIPITHHSGYYPDWLTTDADLEYEWFYNGNTSAPALMYDRYPFFSNTKGGSPVGGVAGLTSVKEYINKRLEVPSHVTFDIYGDYDGEKTLSVHVTGERNEVFSETPARITVCVLESRILAHKQANAGKNYKHSHVFRTSNSVWGDVIEWDGDNFTYDCKLDIDPSWETKNMRIAAFVSAYDENDPCACVVENARDVAFNDIPSGIEDAQADKDVVKTEYYTADGIATKAEAKGMYIEKTIYSDGTETTKKVIK